ncbi:DUF3427 domain-containing protein [Wenzhouxiangella sp. AB-CW3]|uniref:DUF3427 domain-containing protein n=1 Tax=Wenzhouxiangella sp. AB-CW3 TaxID=2771012 RepID=UPI00168AFA02|nr:DUF3427 domain-containing protein [Wenzhouxiangella sp. AB-CW3]QOC22756.1 DUF3427 domain-containing protein [Wenzhouxiangella sp. AB-CW3]
MGDERDKLFGLHESLLTPELRERLTDLGLEDLAEWDASPDKETLPTSVGTHLARVMSTALLDLREKDYSAWEVCLRTFSEALQDSGSPLSETISQIPELPFRQLQEIRRPDQAQVRASSTPRPDIPLAVSALLTGSRHSPSLITQIEKELASADQTEWLVAFIKFSGVRALKSALQRFTETPRSDGQPRLRVATTSYLGATDLKAIEVLLDLPNTEVRVSYDTHRTRLHAKAYLFHRNTGFGTAYVGSANVSRVALDEGLEWTARISQNELPYLWRQIKAGFEMHWSDPAEFEPLTHDDLDRLEASLANERQGPVKADRQTYRFFDLQPYGFQQEILDTITAERQGGIDRHLVIAATGTGKTMIAAFDYRRHASEAQSTNRPSLLFIAHREEILNQALETFRHVLKDSEFGDLLVGGQRPDQSRHLFCSVQSWHSRDLGQLARDHFDYVVLDEAHHAAAKSYQAIIDHIQPQVLLGLTATPERADGRDIRDDFGGRFTHELRLPDAIEARRLAPFHYFGIHDAEGVDLSGLAWQRGGYRTEDLDRVIGVNERRARWVLTNLLDHVADPERFRALGFCVSQSHARFMARYFETCGIPAASLTADSPRQERLRVQRDLVDHKIRVIFTVDLYNEGVDIPEVDTVLFLRPTESLTVYLQQLGRGLRLHEDKPHLTVLDFIAPQHRQFRFADRFRALSSRTHERIDHQVESGFPWLPAGCLIRLDRQSTDIILKNIRDTLDQRRPEIVRQLQALRLEHGDRPGLERMLDWLHFDEPDPLIKRGLPCRLMEAAGGDAHPKLKPYESSLTTGLRHLAIATDRNMLRALAELLKEQPREETEWRMRASLGLSLIWGQKRPGDGTEQAVTEFMHEQPGLRGDLIDLIEYRLQRLLPASNRYFPERSGVLELHASYTREQILLALGKGTFAQPASHREGVLHLPERKVDAFFVTIEKSEKDFAPTTLYEDYALSPELFHWQSQSTTTPESPTGARYINHRERGYQPLLFVRQGKRLPNGLTEPFQFVGPVNYVRHEGSKPMSIVWRMQHPLPARIYRQCRHEAV